MPHRCAPPACVPPFHRLLASSALMLSAVAGAFLAPPMAMAQQAPVTADARAWRIPAGSLDQVLNAFASEAGIELSVASTLTQGKTSPGLNGTYDVDQAFAALLAGQGLEPVRSASGVYALRPRPPQAGDATMLPAVNVQATVDASVTEGSGSFTTSGPVTAATGLGLSLRETPQSVTVITRERMQQQNLNSLAEVAAQTTGVFFNATGTPIGGRSLLTSRGYSINSYQIDGVNLPWEALGESVQYGHGALDTAIYDSVAVVRGSTGLMTGAGQPSALMALTRKKPTSEMQTSLEATLGSWDRRRLMADVAGPLNASGSVRARVVGAYDEGNTWVDDYSSQRSIFYGIVEADLGPRTLLTLTLERGAADSQQAPWAFDYGVYFYFADGVTPIPPSTTTNISAPWAYLNSDRTFASATLTHEFSADWSARLNYGYGRYNTDMRRGMVRRIPQDGSRTAARVLSLDYQYDTHVIDAKLDGRYALFGRQHELTVGANVYRFDHSAPIAYLGDPFPDLAYWDNGQLIYDTPDWDAVEGSEDDYPYDKQIRQSGAYVATRLHPVDRLSVILGGRLSNWDTYTADRETEFHAYDRWDDREYRNEFTPYAGVVVDLTRALSAYASYTQIFQPQDLKDADGRMLDPEEGNTYEIGLKGAWFDNRLNASVAAFESRRDNLAVAIPGEFDEQTGEQIFRAEDHTKGRGWELEVAGALTPRWQIQAGYSWFKNKDSSGAVLDTTQPVQQFKLYTAYQPAWVQGLTLGGSLRWQDDTHADGFTDPLYRIENYFVVGANVGYALTRNVSLAAVFDNLLDEEYRVSNYSHSYGSPRSVTVSLRAQF